MSVILKSLNQQVIFILGATSEVGMATLRQAVGDGAKVFMVGKDENALLRIQNEMRAKNSSTAYAVADLSEVDQIQVAADQCLATFGTIDTWINISAPLKSMKSIRNDFDDSFWSIVFGCQAAVQILNKTGGSLINVANLHNRDSLIDPTIMSALKDAMKGYGQELTTRLKSEKASIAVSFVALEKESLKESATYASQFILKCAQSGNKELSVGSKNVIERLGDRMSAEKNKSRMDAMSAFFRRKKVN